MFLILIPHLSSGYFTSRPRLHNQLRRIGSRFAAGEADGGAAGRGDGEVVGAVACDVGSDVHGDPHTGANGTR